MLSITRSVLTEDLQHQNYQQIDPVYDDTQESPEKDQEKRTIFSPTYSNYGVAKHIGLSPTGKKHVLGYSTVDLKFVPVVKPIIKHGYHYTRPKIHFKHPLVVKPIRPVVHATAWKPLKPVLPVNVPPPVHHHHHVKPVAVPIHKPGLAVKPTLLLQGLPVKPAVPFRPAVPAHVDLHPADHLHTHVDHVHPVDHLHLDHVHLQQAVQVVPAPSLVPTVQAVPVAVAPAPAPAPAPLLPAFRPSPLFEVTKPNLGVLPLGATFQSPVLHNIPQAPQVVHQQFIPQPIATPVLPQPVATPVLPQPVATPVLPQPVATPVVPQHVHPVLPQPALARPVVQTAGVTSVEFHGTYHPTPINGQIPANVLPAVPNQVQNYFPAVDAVHSILPTNYHNFQSHNIPQQPHDISQVFHPQVPIQPQPEQLPPQNFFQQQLPETATTQFAQQPQQQFFQQLPENTASQFVPQTVQPLQPANNDGYVYPQPQQQLQQYHQEQQLQQYQQEQDDGFTGQNIIQPGQTDLQFPLHLPQHTLLNSHQYQQYQDQISQQTENIFRPSLTLEPPYHNRRNSEDEDSKVFDDEEQDEKKRK